jgi:hypothetical protein
LTRRQSAAALARIETDSVGERQVGRDSEGAMRSASTFASVASIDALRYGVSR